MSELTLRDWVIDEDGGDPESEEGWKMLKALLKRKQNARW